MNHESQCRRILKDLRKGKKLTKLQILRRHGAMHSDRRIHDLRADGWPIHTDMIRTRQGKRVAQYSLQ